MYVKSGRSNQLVGGLLTFHPPTIPPYSGTYTVTPSLQYPLETPFNAELKLHPALQEGKWEGGRCKGVRLKRCYLNVYLPNGGTRLSTVVIVSHGNATDVGAMDMRCRELAEVWGSTIVSYDYTGFGESRRMKSGGDKVDIGGGQLPRDVKCTEFEVYKDIREVFEFATGGMGGWLRGRGVEGWDVDGVVLYGQSVGSGPSVWLAGLERNQGKDGRRCEGVCSAGRVAREFACIVPRVLCLNCVCLRPKVVKEVRGRGGGERRTANAAELSNLRQGEAT